MTERNDEHCCFICEQPFKAGEMALLDITEGLGHRACFGDDREAFVRDVDSGEPLAEGDPLPSGFPYDPAEFADPSPTEQKVSSERVSGERCQEIADGLAAMSEMSVFAQGHRAILLTAAAALRSSVKAESSNDGWFALRGNERLGRCATEGCGGQPAFRLEAGGTGSNYCSGCAESIKALSAIEAPAAEGEGYRDLLTGARAISDKRIASVLRFKSSPAAASEVTDEMVELGLTYYSEGGCMGLSTDERREVVRDILTAALQGDR